MSPFISSYHPSAARRTRRLVALAATILIIACMALAHMLLPRPSQPVNAPAAEPVATPYVAITLDNQIAIFVQGSETPLLITDIDVRALPSADREALSAGVTLQDDAALARLLEDYGS